MKSEDEYFYVHYDRHGLPDAVADSKEELHELTGIKLFSVVHHGSSWFKKEDDQK